MAQRPKEQIKTVLLVNFTKDEILNAKKMIWETCQSKLDKLVQRVDTSVRGAECANADDILNALLKLQSTSDLPPIVLCASDIVRLPKYSPGELLEPSLAERLAVVEGQLLQLNDTVSSNATKRTLVEQKCDQLEKRLQNVAAASKSRPAQNNAKTCDEINSATSSHQAWHNVPSAVRLPPNTDSRPSCNSSLPTVTMANSHADDISDRGKSSANDSSDDNCINDNNIKRDKNVNRDNNVNRDSDNRDNVNRDNVNRNTNVNRDNDNRDNDNRDNVNRDNVNRDNNVNRDSDNVNRDNNDQRNKEDISSMSEPFVTPSYQRRKKEKRITNATIKGTASIASSRSDHSGVVFRAAQQKHSRRSELFIANVDNEVLTSDLERYVKSKGFTVEELQCE